MCGIVGAVAQRDIVALLLQGLQRLEYRGYDSAGLAVIDGQNQLRCLRRVGKVKVLAETVNAKALQGNSGVAHTRWATHGVPSERNAHPHVYQHIVIVHNGIIENYQALKALQLTRGYVCSSDTDTEVIAHLVHWEQQQSGESLRAVVQRVIPQLQGSYGMVLLDSRDPQRLVAARSGSPLVIGCGQGEHFIASDQQALLSVTRRLMFLQEGDVAEVTPDSLTLFDAQGDRVERPITDCQVEDALSYKGAYRHYMQKEIYEQPLAIQSALKGRIIQQQADLSELGPDVHRCFEQVQHIQLLACGTSYNAAMVARYWFEALAHIACDVEIASEFRYRHSVTRKNSLLIVLSQSGETADTLAALRLAKNLGYKATLAICNNSGSSLVREADFALLLRAGAEIGVASTKAFTSQLTLLLLLVAFISRLQQKELLQEDTIVSALQHLPQGIEQVLALEQQIKTWALHFVGKAHALFVGRGEYYPIAMEGALKLKEISYIHAEAYAAGELKHGPLALIDDNMPVVVIAPANGLLKKLKSTIEEVRARGGQVYVLTDHSAHLANAPGLSVLALPRVDSIVAPIYYSVALQLLAYFVGLLKGTDIDQPRNLAKSVTVE